MLRGKNASATENDARNTCYHILSVFLSVERDGDGKIDENGGGGGKEAC